MHLSVWRAEWNPSRLWVGDGGGGGVESMQFQSWEANGRLCVQKLEEKLPTGHPPSEGSEPEYSRWREELQRALVETFCDLNEDFACKGQLAGTTVTVVLQVETLVGKNGRLSKKMMKQHLRLPKEIIKKKYDIL
jgi:hypothetical protein